MGDIAYGGEIMDCWWRYMGDLIWSVTKGNRCYFG